ncbi:MAG: hypothetical protein ACXWEY_02940, partial [Bacteroidia bacterium]
MTEVVKIPVIEKKRPLISRIFTVSFLIACILLFSGIIFIDDPNNIIGKAFMIVMLLFLIFLLFIKNPYNKIGSLT